MLQQRHSIEAHAVLRKSCHFCRSRKIRCSGDPICTACKDRLIDCVYGVEGVKGRPRAAAPSDQPRKRLCRSVDGLQKLDATVSSDGVVTPTSETGTDRDCDSTLSGFLGFELESIFSRKLDAFITPPGPITPQPPDANQNHDIYSSSDSQTSIIHSPQLPSRITYNQLFASINHGLVESISTLFGSLGCASPHQTSARFLAGRLATDTASYMFDLPYQKSPMPTPSDEHFVRQMIETWFLHHPLSQLVSKTILLHQLRNGTCDSSLLAVILADAHLVLYGQHDNAAAPLFAWASDSLRTRSSTTASLSTIQALVLLGWHMVCAESSRRGYCYLELARVTINDFQARMQKSEAIPTDHVNGVSLAAVELELVQRISWFTFSLELWAALQLDMPLCDTMLQGVPIGFPPYESSESAVISLDRESGNVATLKIQERQARRAWPLSHISSTLAPIYALYPRASIDFTSTSDEWEFSTLVKLRRLLRSRSELSAICRDVHAILSEGLERLESKQSSHASHIVTTAAYRTILIHLLFPRSDSADTYAGMDTSTLDMTLDAITQFRKVLCVADGLKRDEDDIETFKTMHHTEIFLTGIDTCGRALERILGGLTFGSAAFRTAVSLRYWELLEATTSLYSLCKHPKLQAIPSLRLVKRRLKTVKLSYCDNMTNALPHMPLDFPSFTGMDASGSENNGTHFSKDYLTSMGKVDLNLDWVDGCLDGFG